MLDKMLGHNGVKKAHENQKKRKKNRLSLPKRVKKGKGAPASSGRRRSSGSSERLER